MSSLTSTLNITTDVNCVTSVRYDANIELSSSCVAVRCVINFYAIKHVRKLFCMFLFLFGMYNYQLKDAKIKCFGLF